MGKCLTTNQITKKYFTREIVILMKWNYKWLVGYGEKRLTQDGGLDVPKKNTQHILARHCTDFYAQLLSGISCKIWKIIFVFQD